MIMRLFRNYDPFESEMALEANIFAKKRGLFLWILWFDIRSGVCYNKTIIITRESDGRSERGKRMVAA